MSINDYAAHNRRKIDIKVAGEFIDSISATSSGSMPIPSYKPADPIGVEESALTDTFIGKLKKFWGG